MMSILNIEKGNQEVDLIKNLKKIKKKEADLIKKLKKKNHKKKLKNNHQDKLVKKEEQ
jgi:hypothetical protein